MRSLVGTLASVLVLIGCATNNSPAAELEEQDQRPPIIDMHLHAYFVDAIGPGTLDISPGLEEGHDIRVPESDAANLEKTLVALRKHNIVKASVSGPLRHVREWVAADPERFIPAVALGDPEVGHALEDLSPEQIAAEHRAGRLEILGEITTQYIEMSPDDPLLEPYFAVAAELDIPVHIHTAGLGAQSPGFRSANGRPLLLEPILVRHPKLRIYLENAGYPFLDEMLALFWQYPAIYADISTLIRIVPRAEFYRYLKVLVDAGFGDRLMFGSDQVLWPDSIEVSIRVLEEAPFLTEKQKRDIFYNNAVRFLQLEL